MIGTLAIWLYITGVSFVLGWGVRRLIFKTTGYCCNELDLIWIGGLVFATVYAEYFSLVMKVGLWANIVLVGLCVLIIALEYRPVAEYLQELWVRQKNRDKTKIIIYAISFIVFGVLFICISAQRSHHADTDLYHAQAVRWIEEYGVVNGLGNWHNRLAYNSSFMCLQALFSGTFLLNQSTHTVNGYIAFGMFAYVLYSLLFREKSKLSSSFWFRIAMIIYICDDGTLSILSSPNTDTFALLLVLYILIKWCEYLERHEQNIVPYCLLCVIGLFAVSVKLSVAMIMLLLIKPIVVLLSERKYKTIFTFIILGCLIIAPFLIRNVIISGYLLYPYSAIDLFSVDWKMAKSVVDFDRNEIMAYARGLYDYSLSGLTMGEWFPIWWGHQDLWLKVLLVLSIILLIGYCGTIIIDKLRKKSSDWDSILLFITVSALLLFWVFTAPLARYGKVFAFGIPCIVLGRLPDRHSDGLLRMGRLCVWCGSLVMLVYSLYTTSSDLLLKRPAYYTYRECKEVQWNGINVYVPVEDTYCGYYYMPALPYWKTLDYIELRGTNVEDGFRVKKEAEMLIFNNSGQIYEPVL